jgi:hypothetical protein
MRCDFFSRVIAVVSVFSGLLGSPSEQALRRLLIRRLKFDLLGLPPTIDEVREFETDDSPDAFERLVERYLASPQYGER